jgi:xylulokinase
VGSVPVASFTVTKLRWLAEHEPDLAARVATCVLPHDWLTAGSVPKLTAGPPTAVTPRAPATGRRCRSSTGPTCSSSPSAASWRCRGSRIPPRSSVVRRLGPAVAAGTGDNMAAGLGLSLEPGDVVVSLGTSGTAFARSATPAADASGLVAGSPTHRDSSCRWSRP